MADRETRRLSFGSVAADYDRYRPGPPARALDWLIPPGAQAVLDLAAGTGAVTRELIGRAPRVIAVEPDERMRAVLSARCRDAEILAGRGEDIPLPGASVDAVVINAAWHWLDPDRAVPEIARVLRAGGRLGVMWVARDERVPWVAEFNRLAYQAREATRGRQARDDDAAGPAGPRGRRWPDVTFPPGMPLSPVEERKVEFSLPRTKEELLGLIGTYSGVITLDADQRADLNRQVSALLDRQPWDQVDLPMICRCLRSTRLPG
ncbi:MAG TPA: class I SAM-dependent methyltransferase [Streptosporangiaceae bacterium]